MLSEGKLWWVGLLFHSEYRKGCLFVWAAIDRIRKIVGCSCDVCFPLLFAFCLRAESEKHKHWVNIIYHFKMLFYRESLPVRGVFHSVWFVLTFVGWLGLRSKQRLSSANRTNTYNISNRLQFSEHIYISSDEINYSNVILFLVYFAECGSISSLNSCRIYISRCIVNWIYRNPFPISLYIIFSVCDFFQKRRFQFLTYSWDMWFLWCSTTIF